MEPRRAWHSAPRRTLTSFEFCLVQRASPTSTCLNRLRLLTAPGATGPAATGRVWGGGGRGRGGRRAGGGGEGARGGGGVPAPRARAPGRRRRCRRTSGRVQRD